ncbi:unnamed protein product, partial [Adineta ricciae]
MALIPKQVQIALQTLASKKSTPRIINMLLPSTLQEIERLGKSCVTLANTTHVSFLTVMNLIGEVIATTETTRGLQETKLRQTEIELNVSRTMQVEMTKLGETIRSHYNEAREAVQTAQKEYSRALRKIPTGFQSLLYDLGRAVIGIAKTAGQTLAQGNLGGMGSVVGGSTQSALSMGAGQALTYGKLFSESLNKALPRVNDILNTGKNLLSSAVNPSKELEAYKVTFETFLGSIAAGKNNNFKDKASKLMQTGVSLMDETFNQVKQAMNSGKEIDQNVAQNLTNRFNQLAQDTK